MSTPFSHALGPVEERLLGFLLGEGRRGPAVLAVAAGVGAGKRRDAVGAAAATTGGEATDGQEQGDGDGSCS